MGFRAEHSPAALLSTVKCILFHPPLPFYSSSPRAIPFPIHPLPPINRGTHTHTNKRTLLLSLCYQLLSVSDTHAHTLKCLYPFSTMTLGLFHTSSCTLTEPQKSHKTCACVLLHMETQGKSPLACPCLLCAHATAAPRSRLKPDDSQSCHYGRWNVLSPGRTQRRATRGNGMPCQPRVTECLVTHGNRMKT